MVTSKVPSICKGCRNSVFFTDPKMEDCWYYWENKKHCTQFIS